MAIRTVTWNARSRLSCCSSIGCGASIAADVILCVSPSIVKAYTAPTDGSNPISQGHIEAQVINCVKIRTMCDGSQYCHTFTYDDSQLVTGVLLTPSMIQGAFCKGCLTTFIEDKWNAPPISSQFGNIIQLLADGLFIDGVNMTALLPYSNAVVSDFVDPGIDVDLDSIGDNIVTPGAALVVANPSATQSLYLVGCAEIDCDVSVEGSVGVDSINVSLEVTFDLAGVINAMADNDAITKLFATQRYVKYNSFPFQVTVPPATTKTYSVVSKLTLLDKTGTGALKYQTGNARLASRVYLYGVYA